LGEIRVMREDLLPPEPPPRRHLISIRDLSRDDVERLLATARSFERSLEREVKKLPTLRGRTVVNLFFESSTRTSSSFELAAKRLSADTMSIKAVGSSVDKGESLKDTALTLGAYDPDVIVIRHPQMGARVTLVGPPALLPRGIEAMGCETTTDIEAIAAADVVYVLRMQRERMEEGANYVPSLREYAARWGVTPERLRPGQKVMHPGPMNRGVEIDPRVADAADALIETQVRAGLVTRMAVLYDLLTTGPVPVPVAEPLEVA